MGREIRVVGLTSPRPSHVRFVQGGGPEARSGHQCQAVQLKLLLHGGSNSSTEFNDLHLLDCTLDVPVWTAVRGRRVRVSARVSGYYDGPP